MPPRPCWTSCWGPSARAGSELAPPSLPQASLLVLARTWLALFLLFWPHDFKSPTTAQMMRVMGCCLAAFAVQGPGSCVVALAAALLLAIVGFATRVIVAVIRILYWGVLFRLWSMVAGRFPVLRMLWDRILGRDAGGGPVSRKGLKASKVASTVTREHTVPPVARNPGLSVRGDAGSVKLGGWEAAGSEEGEGEGEEEEAGREAEMGRLQLLASRLGLPAALGSGIWKRLFARGHNTIIDAAVGWGRGSASISCRKVGRWGGGGGRTERTRRGLHGGPYADSVRVRDAGPRMYVAVVVLANDTCCKRCQAQRIAYWHGQRNWAG